MNDDVISAASGRSSLTLQALRYHQYLANAHVLQLFLKLFSFSKYFAVSPAIFHGE